MQQMEIQKLSAVTQEHDESANVRDELFVCLFKKAKAKKADAAKRVEAFLAAEPLKSIDGSCLSDISQKHLFIKFNIPLSLTAAVKRQFSLEKDILKAKRAGLMDEHFEMIDFLKG